MGAACLWEQWILFIFDSAGTSWHLSGKFTKRLRELWEFILRQNPEIIPERSASSHWQCLCLTYPHLLYGQVPELWQGAGEDANEEWGRRAHDVNHGSWQDRDVGVLPGERVKCCHCSVPTFRQSAGEVGEAQRGWSVSPSGQVSLVYSLCISRGPKHPLLKSLMGS